MTLSSMRLPNGQYVTQVNPGETILQYRNIFVHREYAQHGIRLDPDGIVLDVGANIGISALFFHAECPAGQVLAFEPAAPLYEALRTNLAQCGNRASAFKVAVGAKQGTTTLLIYPGTTAMSSIYADPGHDEEVTRQFLANSGFAAADVDDMVAGQYRVVAQECEVTTVSRILADARLDRIDLLKINVEKAESDVLDGIALSDWPKIRQIVMQVHDIAGRVTQVHDELGGRGFTVFVRQDPLLHGTDIYDLAARRSDW